MKRSIQSLLTGCLLGLLLGLLAAGTALAQGETSAHGEGVLEGQVLNGTAGASTIDAGIPVSLRVLRGGAEVTAYETATDASGRFRFEALDTDTSLEYWVEAVYSDVLYTSAEPLRFQDDRASLDATVTVYETTADDSTVRLDSVHLIAESFGAVLRISEIHLFGNGGDRAFVGSVGESGHLETVFVRLPEDAVGLAAEEDAPGERFTEVEGGLVDSEPIPPGSETSLVFISYHLMVTGEAISLERQFSYPVSRLTALVAQPGLAIRSNQLESRGPQVFQDQQYEFYVADALAAGTPLTLELLPVAGASSSLGSEGGQAAAPSSNQGSQELLRWIGFALVGLAVIGAVAYPLATQLVSTRYTSTPGSAINLAQSPQARELIAELADLEEALESGQIDEAAYQEARTTRVQALKSLRP